MDKTLFYGVFVWKPKIEKIILLFMKDKQRSCLKLKQKLFETIKQSNLN